MQERFEGGTQTAGSSPIALRRHSRTLAQSRAELKPPKGRLVDLLYAGLLTRVGLQRDTRRPKALVGGVF